MCKVNVNLEWRVETNRNKTISVKSDDTNTLKYSRKGLPR